MSPTYRLFGVDLSSDFPFTNRLLLGEGPAELAFHIAADPAPHDALKASPPIYRSRYRSASGDSAACLYRLPDCEVLRFPATGDFYLWFDRILWHPSAAGADERSVSAEIPLLGPVLSYWLERRGTVTLHASVVGIEGGAFAFLASHGAGKSGLAAEMMRSGGAALLTDDIAALQDHGATFQVHPGYPQMRMWPDEATWFLGGCEGLPLVHPELSKRRVPVGLDGFGTFCDRPLPLACIYLPERVPDANAALEIRDLSPRDALIELVRHSFAPHLMEAAGLQPARLDVLARLVRTVPVRKLVYPSGFERLGDVVRHLLQQTL